MPLTELGWRPGIITGTSVGSLNGAMFALDLYETARDMWLTIRSQDVMELPEQNADLSELHAFLRDVVRQGGMDVSPLEEIVERVLDEDALRASPIRLGLVTVEQRGLKARELALDDIPPRQSQGLPAGLRRLLPPPCGPTSLTASLTWMAATGTTCPRRWPRRWGADELVCVDLEGVGITRPNRTGLPTTLIRSYWELGDILHFDPDTARRNMELGYYDTRRAMGYLRGCAYAVSCDARSCQDAAAFAWQFGQQQKSVREKIPRYPDGRPCPAAGQPQGRGAGPAGSRRRGCGRGPPQFYTTETLGKAFLEKCEKDRIESFAPLFEGSGRAADAARAALLPNTFLQALVYRVLTGPVLPEVIEK